MNTSDPVSSGPLNFRPRGPKIYQRPLFWIMLVVLVSLLVWFLLLEEKKVREYAKLDSWDFDSSADCGVVLTGNSGRIREGMSLLSNKLIKKLLISGVHPDIQISQLMPLMPVYGDLKREDIILEKKSGTTYGNAQQSFPLIEALQCKDIILITSHIHMYRAYKSFRAVLPASMPIRRYAVVSGRFNVSAWEVWMESFKSIFYSLWAY